MRSDHPDATPTAAGHDDQTVQHFRRPQKTERDPMAGQTAGNQFSVMVPGDGTETAGLATIHLIPTRPHNKRGAGSSHYP
jgi:hypothetical protein